MIDVKITFLYPSARKKVSLNSHAILYKRKKSIDFCSRISL
mgnify:CR=1 FL=1